MTSSCDISGNSVYKNGTCPDPTSLRCLPHLSHLQGTHGTDGCDYPLTGGGGWRCINSMCVHSANATISKEICLAVCGATMPVASTEGMAVKGTLSSD